MLQAFSALRDSIHLLTTSRDDGLTTSTLKFDNPIPTTMKAETTDDDIGAYVDGWIAITPRLQALMNPTLTLEVKRTIIAKAAGM